LALAYVVLGAAGFWFSLNSFSLNMSPLAEARNIELARAILWGGSVFFIVHLSSLFHTSKTVLNSYLQAALFPTKAFCF
jgi:hypothetical protein